MSNTQLLSTDGAAPRITGNISRAEKAEQQNKVRWSVFLQLQNRRVENRRRKDRNRMMKGMQ